jgi:hypothetical protein
MLNMEPNNGQNLWRPSNPTQPETEAPDEQEEALRSRYDGYELTAPQQEAPTEPQAVAGQQLIEWEASEYVHHEKDTSWFIVLAIGTLMALGVALFFRQWTFALLIVVMAVAIVFFARRPPRTLHYALDTSGIRINDRLYPYRDFRAFGVVNEGPLYSVVLIPTGRFVPATSMFFEEQDGEKIVDILAARLPMEKIKVDFVDTLTRKLRF